MTKAKYLPWMFRIVYFQVKPANIVCKYLQLNFACLLYKDGGNECTQERLLSVKEDLTSNISFQWSVPICFAFSNLRSIKGSAEWSGSKRMRFSFYFYVLQACFFCKRSFWTTRLSTKNTFSLRSLRWKTFFFNAYNNRSCDKLILSLKATGRICQFCFLSSIARKTYC